ncbi:hypothetical protein CTI12_AA394380 [Artemisia annua]|uniref:Uncharacterized protein n=1 Tax=Artemisia annua TaxID=35608 RepID=A0A2U1MCS0_ARTAN|nr:hypothetical protein CTI12_AA394380 [Artemisia annua]
MSSGSNSISQKMILHIQGEIAEDLRFIEENTELCKKMNTVKDRSILLASEKGLVGLRMLQNHDVEKAKSIMQLMQMINETEASMREKIAFVERLRHMSEPEALEEGLAFLKMVQNHDREKLTAMTQIYQRINETRAEKMAFIESLGTM